MAQISLRPGKASRNDDTGPRLADSNCNRFPSRSPVVPLLQFSLRHHVMDDTNYELMSFTDLPSHEHVPLVSLGTLIFLPWQYYLCKYGRTLCRLQIHLLVHLPEAKLLLLIQARLHQGQQPRPAPLIPSQRVHQHDHQQLHTHQTKRRPNTPPSP
jgi:hypothetical protein